VKREKNRQTEEGGGWRKGLEESNIPSNIQAEKTEKKRKDIMKGGKKRAGESAVLLFRQKKEKKLSPGMRNGRKNARKGGPSIRRETCNQRKKGRHVPRQEKRGGGKQH